MRASLLLSISLVWLGGCRTDVIDVADGFCQRLDLKSDMATDMSAGPPKCAAPAARGLAGDSLLCVDFSQITSLSDTKLMGWDFVSNCGGNNWEVAGGNLQIKMFDQFNSTCGVKLPSIDLAQPQYSKYNSITIAVRHKVDLDLGITNPNQLARVYLGTVNPASLVTTVSETQLEQQMTLTVDKQKLPAALNNVYQWILQISSFQKQNKQGWQISSVAILGNQ